MKPSKEDAAALIARGLLREPVAPLAVRDEIPSGKEPLVLVSTVQGLIAVTSDKHYLYSDHETQGIISATNGNLGWKEIKTYGTNGTPLLQVGGTWIGYDPFKYIYALLPSGVNFQDVSLVENSSEHLFQESPITKMAHVRAQGSNDYVYFLRDDGTLLVANFSPVTEGAQTPPLAVSRREFSEGVLIKDITEVDNSIIFTSSVDSSGDVLMISDPTAVRDFETQEVLGRRYHL